MNINEIKALNKSLADKVDDIAAELRSAIKKVILSIGVKEITSNTVVETLGGGSGLFITGPDFVESPTYAGDITIDEDGRLSIGLESPEGTNLGTTDLDSIHDIHALKRILDYVTEVAQAVEDCVFAVKDGILVTTDLKDNLRSQLLIRLRTLLNDWDGATCQTTEVLSDRQTEMLTNENENERMYATPVKIDDERGIFLHSGITGLWTRALLFPEVSFYEDEDGDCDAAVALDVFLSC